MVIRQFHCATEHITSFPEDVVDFVLGAGDDAVRAIDIGLLFAIQYSILIVFVYTSLLGGIPR
jgi:hypothetical protein